MLGQKRPYPVRLQTWNLKMSPRGGDSFRTPSFCFFMIILGGLDPKLTSRGRCPNCFFIFSFVWVPICQSKRLIRQSQDLSFRNMLDMFGKKNCGNKQSKAKHNTHRIHVWYIYLHEWLILMVNVGEYTSPMDPMG